jgi:hypothetical protein
MTIQDYTRWTSPFMPRWIISLMITVQHGPAYRKSQKNHTYHAQR